MVGPGKVPLLGLQMASSWLSPHRKRAEGLEEMPLLLLLKGTLILPKELHPYDLIISHRPYLQMPFHWDQGFTICGSVFVFFFGGGAFTQSVAQGKLFVLNTGFYKIEWIRFFFSCVCVLVCVCRIPI